MSPASRRSKPLTRREIVETSLRLTRRDGLAGLTMRAVASELGVTPMAVYYHVKDKQQLIELVTEAAVARRKPLELAGDGWEASLRRHLVSMWEELVRYPGLGGHLISQPDMGATPQSIEYGMHFFEAAGFPRHEARLAWTFALTYMHGRFNVDMRLRGSGRAVERNGVPARDYVTYGIDAVIAGIARLRTQGRRA